MNLNHRQNNETADLRIRLAELERQFRQLASRPANLTPDGLAIQVVQSAHGLSVGNIVRHNGTGWVKAKADSEANAIMGGMVIAAPTEDLVVIAPPGSHVSGVGAFTAGAIHYLSAATAGVMTTTAPSIVVPCILADSTSGGVLLGGWKTSVEKPARVQTYYALITTAGVKTVSCESYPATIQIMAIGGGGGGGGSSTNVAGGGGASGSVRLTPPYRMTGPLSLTAVIGAAGTGGAGAAGGGAANGVAGGLTSATVVGWWAAGNPYGADLYLAAEGGAGGGRGVAGTYYTNAGVGGTTGLVLQSGGSFILQPFDFYASPGQPASGQVFSSIGIVALPGGRGGGGVVLDGAGYGSGASGGSYYKDGEGTSYGSGGTGAAGAIVIMSSSPITVT